MMLLGRTTIPKGPCRYPAAENTLKGDIYLFPLPNTMLTLPLTRKTLSLSYSHTVGTSIDTESPIYGIWCQD